ncbi:unnamed protein product [Rhizophagus irregularis]|nr:unnamed protein product [Rhizophagus irregularis]
MWTQFSHLQYKPNIYQRLISKNSKKTLNYSENNYFTTDGAEEVLYSLSRKYCMNRTEIQRLRAYYVTALNRNANQLSLITNSIQKYGKLQTKNDLTINSKLSNRKGDVARTNYCIAVKLLVDRNAHRPNAPVILEEREFFGEVQYFFSHQYNSDWSMLAYVQWVRNPHPSGHGPLKFRDHGAFEVINVSAICRNVGFLKMVGKLSFDPKRAKVLFKDVVNLEKSNNDSEKELSRIAMRNMALIYHNSHLIRAFEPSNLTKVRKRSDLIISNLAKIKLKRAFKWYKKSFDLYDSQSAYNLGLLYESDDGIKKDEKQAEYYFRKAVEFDNNNIFAKKKLGNILFKKKDANEKDEGLRLLMEVASIGLE